MRFARLSALSVSLVSLLAVNGCGGHSSSSTTTTGAGGSIPSISSLAPTSANVGGAAFVLSVNGSNFTSSSQVQWNGSAKTTTFTSSTQLGAQIAAADIATAKTVTVSVSDPAGSSNTLNFSVTVGNNPPPIISSLAPASAVAGSGALTLTVTGTGFVTGSQVQWNGSVRPTTVVSTTTLTAQITAADVASAGNAQVTVVSPQPGGGTSLAAGFTISPAPNPAPAASSLSPTMATAGGPGFSLVVTGTNFISTSQVQWNGAALTTSVNSATMLTAQVPAADIATAGTASVVVSNPAPGGGTTSQILFTISVANNPVPTLAALSPSNVTAGSAAFALTVTGSGFVNGSQVLWNGSPRPTAFASGTTLTAQITAADVASTGSATVSVTTPGPGGGTSGTLTFTIAQPSNPLPVVSSLSPSSAVQGGGAFKLTVFGTGFVQGTQVDWNGAGRQTTYVSSTRVDAQITAADIVNSGNYAVSVVSPAPGGGTSGSISFTVSLTGNPVPVLTSLTPNSTVVGTNPVQINLNGTNFTAGSQVRFGSPYATPLASTMVDSTLLQATIPVSMLTAGVQSVYVTNPFPGGGTSNALDFTIEPSATQSFTVQTVNVEANDIVWDAAHGKLYLSIPGKSASNGNTILPVDPATLEQGSAIFAGSEPNTLAIADDDSLLYVAVTGSDSVQRFRLPGLATDINFNLGQTTQGNTPYIPVDLQVAPGEPHTLAVLRSTATFGNGSVAIYDDAAARTKPSTSSYYYSNYAGKSVLQWGSDATHLYVADEPFYYIDSLTVGSDGVDGSTTYQPSGYSGIGSGMHFDRGTKYLYDNTGHVVDPSTGQPVGVFNAFGSYASGVMIPDSSIGTAFFVGQSTVPFSSSYVLETFDINHFTATGSITLSNVQGTPIRLIRWGSNGLALITAAGSDLYGHAVPGQLYLITGSFVNPQAVVGKGRTFEAGTAAVRDTWSATKPSAAATTGK